MPEILQELPQFHGGLNASQLFRLSQLLKDKPQSCKRSCNLTFFLSLSICRKKIFLTIEFIFYCCAQGKISDWGSQSQKTDRFNIFVTTLTGWKYCLNSGVRDEFLWNRCNPQNEMFFRWSVIHVWLEIKSVWLNWSNCDHHFCSHDFIFLILLNSKLCRHFTLFTDFIYF